MDWSVIMKCVFCPIPDVPIVREWPRRAVRGIVAFEPLNPVTPGHLIIVPRMHTSDAGAMPIVTSLVMLCAGELVKDIPSANIITSKGAFATQTVNHLHVHVVPRRKRDGLHLPWTVDTNWGKGYNNGGHWEWRD